MLWGEFLKRIARGIRHFPIIVLVPALAASCSAHAQENSAISYDALGRITGVVKTGGANSGQATAVTYDASGNRANYAISGSPTPATLSVTTASANEGSALVFTVTRGGSTAAAVSASWTTSDGSAHAGTNYTVVSGSVNFAAGVTSTTISVPTIDDHVVTANLTMNVTLSAPSSGAVLGTATAAGTIVNTDTAITLSVGGASAQEGNPLTFTVTRSGASTSAVSAHWATSNGTALAGTNYNSGSGTVTLASGVNTGTITVTTLRDCVVTTSKFMYVTLSSPSAGVTVSGATGAGTIANKDSINCN